MTAQHLSLLLTILPVVNSLHIHCLYQKLPPGHSVKGISGLSYDGTAECSLRYFFTNFQKPYCVGRLAMSAMGFKAIMDHLAYVLCT